MHMHTQHTTTSSSHLFHILHRVWVTNICFNDTLSALYWEIKGWYLQNLAQWGYNNILLPLVINCSTLKGEEERIFKRDKRALYSDFQQYVYLSGCMFCEWTQPATVRLYCLFEIMMNSQLLFLIHFIKRAQETLPMDGGDKYNLEHQLTIVYQRIKTNNEKVYSL